MLPGSREPSRLPSSPAGDPVTGSDGCARPVTPASPTRACVGWWASQSSTDSINWATTASGCAGSVGRGHNTWCSSAPNRATTARTRSARSPGVASNVDRAVRTWSSDTTLGRSALISASR